MRVVFLGTPDFSIPTLEAILQSHHEVVAVVTQPDKPKGRGQELSKSPVKLCAEKHGLMLLQYAKIRRDGVSDLRSLNADIMVTCAYGQILSQEIIDIAPHGIINVHASLLPKYRGSAPINWAIICGEKTSGVTIMKTALSVDSGDVLLQKKIDILDNETAGELFDRLSLLGAGTIVKALDLIESGKAVFMPQDEALATHYPMLKKEDGKIDFSKSSREVVNHIRGMNPWPCAYFELNGVQIKVFKAISTTISVENCGTVLYADSKNGLIVSTANGAVEIEELQYPNSKRMTAKSFLCGKTIEVGTKLC